MNKIYNIIILLSFLGLWITSIVPESLEVFLGFILIFSFGILHGSNDILLIENIFNKKTKHPFLKVLTIYLLTVFIALSIFYFVPLLALILFIIFSAFHFGEQHWEDKLFDKKVWFIKVYYFFYGLFILMLLFIFNNLEVLEVVESITKYQVSSEFIKYSFITNSIILFLLSLYKVYSSRNFKQVLWSELFYLIVFSIIFKVSTLIWGFTIYFIFWHSIPSLFEQVNFIYGHFSSETFISYVKKAFLYWLISLIGLVIVFCFFKDEKLFYAIIFSFIAAVTFPHSLVINKMFKYKKTQPPDSYRD